MCVIAQKYVLYFNRYQTQKMNGKKNLTNGRISRMKTK